MKPWSCLASCVVLTVAAATPAAASHQMAGLIAEADALYAKREDSANARRAAEMLAASLRRNATDFEAAWRLARVQYWIGNHAPERERKQHFELGVAAGRQAIAARSQRPEGHFWLGMDLAGLAQLGMMLGLRYRSAVRDEFETTARLDPGFEAGSAFTALGDWYLRVPGFLGGDKRKAEEYLRRALTYDPNGTATRYFLAETLIATSRTADAREELQRVIDAPFDSNSAPEDKEWKQRARELLTTLGDPRR